MQGVDRHEILDEGGDVGSELAGAAATPHRGPHEERGLLGRVVGPVGLHPFGHPTVGFDDVRTDERLNETGGAACFDVLADVAPWHRVEGAADVDVTVRADLGPRPGRGLETLAGQSQQGGLFDGCEHRSRGGAVEAAMASLPGDLAAPGHRGGLHLFEAGPLAAAKEALADVAHRAFDAWLVLGLDRPGRVDETAVVLGQLHVPAVELRVIQIRFDRPGLQVVRNEPGGDPAEELERGDVRLDPGRLVHRKHRPDEHVPAHREDHHEHVQLAAAARHRVGPQGEISVIDLGFAARLDIGAPHRRVLGGDLVAELEPHVTPEAGHAHREPVLIAEALPHRRCLVRLEHRRDPVAMDVDVPEREAPRLRVEQFGEPAPNQLGPLGPAQRRAARNQAGRFGRGDVLADRPAVYPDTRRDHRLRSPGVPVLQNLYNVDHLERSPCHVRSQLAG